MSSNPLRSRKAASIIIAVGVLIVAAGVLRHFTAIRGVEGRIRYLDPVQRSAVVETIDPATGATREFRGFADADCVITINGRPAQLAEVRVGDMVRIKVRIERRPLDSKAESQPDGKDEPKRPTKRNVSHIFMGERIEVTRPEEATP